MISVRIASPYPSGREEVKWILADLGLLGRQIGSPLSLSAEGQKSPGKLDILQEGNCKSTGVD